MRLHEVKKAAPSIDLSNYTNYLQTFKEPAIYRGTSRAYTAPINVVNPKLKQRKSANTSNEYTLLLSNLPNWSAYPKRNRSLICSTSEERAASYAYYVTGSVPYAVVLPNKFRLGVCPEHDLWFSFDNGLDETTAGDMSGFNYALSYMLGKEIKTWPNLQAKLLAYKPRVEPKRKIAIKIVSPMQFTLHQYIDYYMTKHKTNALEIIQSMLDPSFNEFKLVTNLADIPIGTNKEVWTDSTCLLMSKKQYKMCRKMVL